MGTKRKINKIILNSSIALLVSVLLCVSCYKETAVPVAASFSVTFVNEDESIPVQIAITNQSTGADTFEWTFTGAEPFNSTDENPGSIVYNKAGTYTISLKVSNVDGSTDSMEKEITVVEGISIDFFVEIIEGNYAPVEVKITNTTGGEGLTYTWTFEGGTPASSTEKHPENVFFEIPGEHLILLKVSNGFESFSAEANISVAPTIEAIFDWKVAFFDDDYQAPVTISMTNSSISATSYQWSFSSGSPEISTEETPSVTFNIPGIYTIALEAWNGKRTHTATKTITIHPNTNIRTFSNIELAINNAHNTNVKGAFFSTSLREIFTANQVTEENGAAIDIVFFGLNNSFGFNKFVSPDEVAINGFIAIPNATHTKFINSQEICECEASLSVSEFDSIIDDTLLRVLNITETNKGLLQFDNSVVPRIVLFETQDGRKGAIKIKGYVDDGEGSYIICDIKVMKE